MNRWLILVLASLWIGVCPPRMAIAGAMDGPAAVAMPGQDSSSEGEPAGTVGSPVVLLMLVALVVALLVVGVVLCLASLAVVGFLVALGVVSTSVLIGLIARRSSLGFRALLAQLCLLLSVGLAIGGVWSASRFGHLGLPSRAILGYGVGCGLAAGIALFGAVDRLLGLASRALASAIGAARSPGRQRHV